MKKRNTKIIRRLKDLRTVRLLFSIFMLVVFFGTTSVNAKEIITGVTTTEVNLREGPGTTYNSLGLLNVGCHVTVISKYDDTWVYVSFKGQDSSNSPVDVKGYVASKYLRLSSREDYSDLPKVEGLYGSGEKSSIGCDNIIPSYDWDNDCTLRINAATANYDTVLKICKVGSGDCIRMVYVRRGTTYDVKNIPFGTYYLKTASGEDMRKKIDKNGNCLIVFVHNASYEKTETYFRFYRETKGNMYSDVGWEYVLEPRIHSIDSKEVSTDDISPEEFNR